MLVQSSHPGSIEASISFEPKDGKDNWIPGAGTPQKCHKYERSLQDRCEVLPVREGKRNIDDLCSLNLASSCSQLSTVSTMSESSTPAFVYQRKKLRRNIVDVFPAQALANLNVGCLSAISSGAPAVTVKQGPLVFGVELESEVGAGVVPSVECCAEATVLKSASINRSLVVEEPCSKGDLKSDIHRTLDFCCINDSYSSSKSNIEIGSTSLRAESDDTGECSSSSALLVEDSQDDPSERDICISILRSQGSLEGVWPIRICTSAGEPATSCESCYTRTCKVCCLSESTLKMLICDQCEEAFHIVCCNPRVKKIPLDEWFCQSCVKKKHKILNESTTGKEPNINSEMSRSRNATSKEELGPIESMLRSTEPHISGVRIGLDFQAEIPDWSGSSIDEVDTFGEPLEINHSEFDHIHGWHSSRPSRLSSIGNWLQCREVVESVDGTICGKWRRAPLFEVQTDDWECFCAFLWDPAHADCAVPQELDTEEVLRQLRYVEMLRPRLAARRRKLDRSENVGSENHSENVRKTPIM